MLASILDTANSLPYPRLNFLNVIATDIVNDR